MYGTTPSPGPRPDSSGRSHGGGAYGSGYRDAAATASRYQELEVLSASPQQLVVIVYDHLLACLKRARIAIAQEQPETRIAQLGRAKDAIAELLATLDHAKGGEIARTLSGLYAFFLTELGEIGMHPDAARLTRVIELVEELRDAWAQIAEGGA